MRKHFLLSFALCAFALTPSAQTIFVGPPGSGAGFTDIQPAIDAASPGDTVYVLPGTYSRFVLDKPLNVVGQGSDQVLVQETSSAFCSTGVVVAEVTGIPAGDKALVSGMAFAGAPPASFLDACFAVRVRDNDGTVVLSDVEMGAGLAGLHVTSSSFVMLLSSRIEVGMTVFPFGGYAEAAAVRADDCELWIVDSPLTGLDAGPLLAATQGFPGLVATNATIYVARSPVVGGGGGILFSTCFSGGLVWGLDGAAGIEADGTSLVRLVGGPGALVQAGSGAAGGGIFCPGDGAPAIRASGATAIFRAASLPVNPTLNGDLSPNPPVETALGATDTVLAFRFPTLATTSASGGPASLAFKGNPSGVAVLFFALNPGPPTIFGGIDGAGALDGAGLLMIGSIPLDAGGNATLSFNVPTAPALLGLTGYFQWVETGAPQTGLSNPILITVTN